MAKPIRLREYTSMMIAARRVSRQSVEKHAGIVIGKALLDQLLETLDDLTGIDTSVPNKVTMKVPR